MPPIEIPKLIQQLLKELAGEVGELGFDNGLPHLESGSTIPYSASKPRVWLINEVRLWTKRSRMRWSDCRSWHLRLFTGTKRIVGRPAASKIACASVASFLDPRTKGLTK